MRIVLVSSPGSGPGPHWSQDTAAALATLLRAGGADVHWFCVAARALASPAQAEVVSLRRRPRVERVAAGLQHTGLEVALTRVLRARPADAVVHLGAGAGGSPNVGWVAARMGSPAFAVVRSAEVVCQRGDLVHASGAACERFDDAERCRACCARGVVFGPRADDLRNRRDLLLAGLAVAEAVFVEDDVGCARLVSYGLTARRLHATHDVTAIAARLGTAPIDVRP